MFYVDSVARRVLNESTMYDKKGTQFFLECVRNFLARLAR